MADLRETYLPGIAAAIAHAEEVGRGDRQFVSALARGLSVLRTFHNTSELSPADIIRRTGLPQATVWRICRTLIELGWLTRISGTDKLRVGLPVVQVGRAALAVQSIVDVARPHMRRLQARFEGAMTLAVRDGIEMLCLDRVEGRAVFVADMRVGYRLALTRASLGWAYLAGLDNERRAVLLKELEHTDPVNWTEVGGQLTRALADYQTSGYVVSKGTLHGDINAAAVPLHLPGGAVAALSCGGLASAFNDATLVKVGPALRQAARNIEDEAVGVMAGE